MTGTADVELLPLPEADGFMESFDTYGCPVGAEDAWAEETVKDYARACVAQATAELEAEMQVLAATADARFRDGWNRATAAKDAELVELRSTIESLRAEVDFRDSVIATHAADTREYQKRISQAEARAERLAEALALLPDDSDMVEYNSEEGSIMFCCGREVRFDWVHGPIHTHDEDCWYERMRVMRDHDQEG